MSNFCKSLRWVLTRQDFMSIMTSMMLIEHIHPTYHYKILAGERRPSRKVALLYEKVYKISRIAWLYPEEFFNPEQPFLYQGKYPPSLDHLSGEALEFAKKIIEAFPEKPPSKEEFKKFKKELRRKKRNA